MLIKLIWMLSLILPLMASNGCQEILGCDKCTSSNTKTEWTCQSCESSYFLQGIKCEQCHQSCGQCLANNSEASCLSCSSDEYLQIIDPILKTGNCIQKIDSLEKQQILVLSTNSYKNLTDHAGLIFNNFYDGILKAFELTSSTKGQTIEILLEPTTHWLKKTDIENFYKKKQIIGDFVNPSFNLTIRPLSCSDFNISYKVPCSSIKPIIRNRVGSLFQIQVPQTLNIQNIIFNSLESSLNLSSPYSNSEVQKCKFDKNQVNCPEDKDNMIQFDDVQICAMRSYSSIFNFNVHHLKTNSSCSQAKIQELKITNCEFKNIFYEIGSIVRLPERRSGVPWKVEITETKFENMSFCGSILSNDFPQFLGTSFEEIQIQNNFDVLPGNIATKLNCNKDDKCQQLIFSKNTITNLNALKTNQESIFKQKVNWQLHKFGLILHLIDFKNDIEIVDNTISQIFINFKDVCRAITNEFGCFEVKEIDDWQDVNILRSPNQELRYPDLIQEQNDAYQLHSLFVIQNLIEGKSVNFQGNNFDKIQMTNSIINIHQKSTRKVDSQGKRVHNRIEGIIVIQNNTFSEIGSYIGSNIATITNEVLNDTSIGCDMVVLAKGNTFKDIIGSCQVDTGLIRAQCNYTLAQTLNNNLTQKLIYQTKQVSQNNQEQKRLFQEDLHPQLNETQKTCDKNAIQRMMEYGVQTLDDLLQYPIISNQFLFFNNSISGSTLGVLDKEGFGGSMLDISDFLVLRSQGNIFKDLIEVSLDQSQMNSYFWNNFKESLILPQEQNTCQKSLFQHSSIIQGNYIQNIDISHCSFSNFSAASYKTASIMKTNYLPQVLEISDSKFQNIKDMKQSLFAFDFDDGVSGVVNRRDEMIQCGGELWASLCSQCQVQDCNESPCILQRGKCVDSWEGYTQNGLLSLKMKRNLFSRLKAYYYQQSFNKYKESSMIVSINEEFKLSQEQQFCEFTQNSKNGDGKIQMVGLTINEQACAQLVKKNALWANAAQYQSSSNQCYGVFQQTGTQVSEQYSNCYFIQKSNDVNPTSKLELQTQQNNSCSVDIPFVERKIQKCDHSEQIEQKTLKPVFIISDSKFDEISGSSYFQNLMELNLPYLVLDKLKFSNITSTNILKLNLHDKIEPEPLVISNSMFMINSSSIISIKSPLSNQLQQILIKNVSFSNLNSEPFDLICNNIQLSLNIQYCNFSNIQIPNNNLLNIQGKYLKLSIDKSTFMNIQSDNWFIFNERVGPGQVSISNSIFDGNEVQSQNYFDGSVFKILNYAEVGLVTFSNISVSNFHNRQSGGFIMSFNSSIDIDNAQVYNLSANKGGFIYLDSQKSGQISIKNSNFENIKANIGSFIYYDSEQKLNLTIQNCILKKFQSNQDGLLNIKGQNTNVLLKNISIEESISQTSNSLGTISTNQLTIQSSIFKNCQSVSDLIHLNSTYLIVSNSQFIDNQSQTNSQGIVVTTKLNSTITFQNCIFKNTNLMEPQNDINGGFIYFNNNMSSLIMISQFPEVQFNNCSFQNGRAQYGGAIYVTGDIKMVIQDSYFLGNKASKKGGALYFGNVNRYYVKISKSLGGQGNEFSYNNAQNGGDNIYFEELYSNNRQMQILPAIPKSSYIYQEIQNQIQASINEQQEENKLDSRSYSNNQQNQVYVEPMLPIVKYYSIKQEQQQAPGPKIRRKNLIINQEQLLPQLEPEPVIPKFVPIQEKGAPQFSQSTQNPPQNENSPPLEYEYEYPPSPENENPHPENEYPAPPENLNLLPTPPQQSQNGRNLESTVENKNSFFLSDSVFTTPDSSGQIQLIEMYQVEMKNLKFNKMFNSRAIQGGSIYALNVHSISIHQSQFMFQESVLHGGALFIEQTSKSQYSFEPVQESQNICSNLLFSYCTSISGGAVFVSNQNKMTFQNSELSNNIIQKPDINNYNKIVDNYKLDEKFLTSNYTQLIGQGANIMLLCDNVCDMKLSTLDIKNTTSTSEIKTIQNNLNYGVIIKGEKPSGLDITNRIPGQESNPIYDKYFYIPSEIYIEEKEKSINRDQMTFRNRKFEIYNGGINQYIAGNYLNLLQLGTNIFQGVYVLLDSEGNIRTNDNESYIKFNWWTDQQGLDWYPGGKYKGYLGMMQENSTVPQDELIVYAKNGILDFQDMKVYGPYQGLMHLETIFKTKNIDYPSTKSYIFQTGPPCLLTSSLSIFGICSPCLGPNHYLLTDARNKKEPGPVDCQVCNQTVFSCHGGQNLTSKIGYQQIFQTVSKSKDTQEFQMYSDSYLQCPKVLGYIDVCLENNQCLVGYTGLMCNSCDDNYFKASDGQCKNCNNYRNHPIVNCIVFIILMLLSYALMKLSLRRQENNSFFTILKMSQIIIHFVIWFILISKIFSSAWNKQQNLLDVQSFQSLQLFTDILTLMYDLPVQTLNFQCYFKISFLHPLVYQAYLLSLLMCLMLTCLQGICVSKPKHPLIQIENVNDFQGELNGSIIENEEIQNIERYIREREIQIEEIDVEIESDGFRVPRQTIQVNSRNVIEIQNPKFEHQQNFNPEDIQSQNEFSEIFNAPNSIVIRLDTHEALQNQEKLSIKKTIDFDQDAPIKNHNLKKGSEIIQDQGQFEGGNIEDSTKKNQEINGIRKIQIQDNINQHEIVKNVNKTLQSNEIDHSQQFNQINFPNEYQTEPKRRLHNLSVVEINRSPGYDLQYTNRSLLKTMISANENKFEDQNMVSQKKKSQFNQNYIEKDVVDILKQKEFKDVILEPQIKDRVLSSNFMSHKDLQNFSVLRPKSIEDSIKKAKQKFKFRPWTLFVMSMSFLINVQIIEQILMLWRCEKIEIGGDIQSIKQFGQLNTTLMWQDHPWLKNDINPLDSSLTCSKQTMIIHMMIGGIFFLIFAIILPLTMIYYGRNEYSLEYSSFIIKIIVLLISIFVNPQNKQLSSMMTLMLLILQTVLYFSFRYNSNDQSSYKNKLNSVYKVESSMFACLLFTSFLSVISVIWHDNIQIQAQQSINLVIVLMNLCFILFWIIMIIKIVIMEIHSFYPQFFIQMKSVNLNEKEKQEIIQNEKDNELKKLQQDRVDEMMMYLQQIQREQAKSKKPIIFNEDVISNLSMIFGQDSNGIEGRSNNSSNFRSNFRSVNSDLRAPKKINSQVILANPVSQARLQSQNEKIKEMPNLQMTQKINLPIRPIEEVDEEEEHQGVIGTIQIKSKNIQGEEFQKVDASSQELSKLPEMIIPVFLTKDSIRGKNSDDNI